MSSMKGLPCGWILACGLFLLPVFALEALGNPEEGDFQVVEGQENWEHRFDISGLEEGKYNLVIRGKDEAGNVAYEGPFNVLVDPASDLPVAHISNPAPGQRAASRLNVVGTCIDDDAVERVEVRLDDGAFQAAHGREIWSLLLDLSAAAEGEHALSARGVDANGNTGPSETVRFKLDRQPPVLDITSPAGGDLVSGRVEITGALRDGNGVASLSLRAGRDGPPEPVKLSYDKGEDTYSFSHTIDTREREDGPLVLWFRATDRTGSTGEQATLLFVNNQEPVLEILSPAADTAVSGQVTVVGRALDKIGLAGLRFEAGDGQAGDIELVPGNPYWTHTFDLSSAKAGNAQIAFTLENRTGNTATEKLRLRVDPEADRPRVLVAYPAAGAEVTGPVYVAGFLLDDDGGQSVDYSVDGGADLRLPADGAFCVQLQDLQPGKHTVSITATDSGGVVGKPAQLIFSVSAPAPVVAVKALAAEGSPVPLSPGAVLAEEAKATLSGEIRAVGAVKAEVIIDGATPKSLSLKRGEKEEVRLFDILLPREPSGRLDFVVRATDAAGHTGEYRSFLFRGAAPEDGGLVLSDARIGPDGVVRLSDGIPLRGYLAGDSVAEVALDPPVAEVKAGGGENLIQLEAAASGFSVPTTLRVRTSGGRSYEAGPFRFLTDRDAPEIVLTSPAPGAWVKNELRLEGRIADASVLGSLEYSLDGGQSFSPVPAPSAVSEAAGASEGGAEGPAAGVAVPQPVSAAGAAAPGDGGPVALGATLALGAAEDGPRLLLLKATDKAGNVALLPVPLLVDRTPPRISLIAPREEDELNGLVSLAGTVEDEGRVTRVELTEDGESYRPVAEGSEFRLDLNLSQYERIPETLALRATDAAGNSSLYTPKLRVNLEADRPTVEIQIPSPEEKICRDFVVSGMAFDDDQVRSLSYRLDGGDPVSLTGGNNFSIPVDIDAVGDNEHTIEVRAQDIGGLESQAALATFLVSTSEPRSLLASPGIDEVVRGLVELRGTSTDANGIEEVLVSFDNGHSFHEMAGAEEWSYRLDTNLVGDGTVALLFKAVDRAGVEGIFTTTIRVDNEAPEVELDSPRDGEQLSRRLVLDGRVRDNLELASLTATLTPAGGSPDGGRQLSLPTEGVFSQEVDIDGLPQGWYNLMLEATDRADNRRYVACNVRVVTGVAAERIELLHPAPGAEWTGPLVVTGQVLSERQIGGVVLMVDGNAAGSAAPDSRGYFRFALEESLAQGEHELAVQATGGGDSRLGSEPQRVRVRTSGGWVRIASHSDGDFVTGRPYLEGEAGYLGPQAGVDETAAEPGGSARREQAKQVRVEEVLVSFDNGKSFRKAAGRESWRYRLETQELVNGPLRVLVKAVFVGGEVAVSNALLFVDTHPPELSLLAPREGGRFNESITVLGSARDDAALEEVAVSLRPGDKSRYAVPKFIQGMYLDVHALGATYADVGLGLSFFDDNVKLQAGVSPSGRFSGLVVGTKLLANIFTLPFSYFFGPSLDFFSMSLAVGANFSYFTMSGDTISFTDGGLVLGAVVAQLEFARFRVPDWRALHTYSLYSEFQLWFISSDVEGGLAPRLSFGFRLGLF
jgi:hypothetical protein